MNILDYITIILFSIGVLITGVSFSKTGKDMKSFFSGGGNVPWGMSGLSLFMGFFSAGTFVVWGSIAYSYGMVSIIIQLTMAVAGYAVGMDCSPMASYSQSHGCRIHNGPSWCQDAEDIYLYFFGRVGFYYGVVSLSRS